MDLTPALVEQMNERGRDGWELVTVLAPWEQVMRMDETWTSLRVVLFWKKRIGEG